MRLILSILLFSSLAVANQQALTYYQQGNAQYESGNYSQAIAAYEKALASGYESAELYYNLGNAYFKNEQLGKSILFYERAIQLRPNDADIKYNLELARLRVIDKVVTPPEFFLSKIWRSVRESLSINQWAILWLVSFMLLILLLIFRLLLRTDQIRYIGRILFVPLFIITLISGGFFLLRITHAASTQYGVILAAKVSVLSAPANDATEVFSLHEGTKVQVGESSGAYVKIQLPDGKVGWMRQDGLEKI